MYKKQLLALLLFLISSSHQSQAQFQLEASQQIGLDTYSTYHGGDIDSINMMNGSLSLRIPLFSLPQLGGLKASFSVQLTNGGWNLATSVTHSGGSVYGTETWVHANAPLGATLIFDQDLWPRSYGESWYQYNNKGTVESQYLQNRFDVADPMHQTHPLVFDANNLSQLRTIDQTMYLFRPSQPRPFDPLVYTGGSASPDGYSFSYLPALGTLYTPDGIQYIFAASGSTDSETIQDRDGNAIHVSPAVWSGGNSTLTDTVGRVVNSPTYSSSTSGCPTINAANQPVVGSSVWNVPAGDTATAQYTFCYAQINVNTAFGFPHDQAGATCSTNCYSNYQSSGTATVLQSIVLPNNTYWAFIYDSAPSGSDAAAFGDLTEVIFPLGGFITYDYTTVSLNAIYANARAVAHRTEYPSGSGGASNKWTYSFPTPTGMGYSYSTSVADPDGNTTTTTYTDQTNLGDWRETSRTVSSGSSNTVQTIATSYLVNNIRWSIPSQSERSVEILPQTITTTTAANISATDTISYDSGFTATQFACAVTSGGTSTSCSSIGNTVPSGSNYATVLMPFGLQTTKATGEYGGGTAKIEQDSYLWTTSPDSPYLANNELSFRSSQSINDSSNNPAAMTQYAYDEADYVADTSALAAHLTTTTRWVVGNTYINRHGGWSSTGQPVLSVDGNGNKTTTEYSGSYGGLYATKITNAAGQITNLAYEYNSGAKASVTDPNSATTSYEHNDALDRLTKVVYPDEGWTAYIYTDNNSQSSNVAISRAIDASTTEQAAVYVDGYGRRRSSQLAADNTEVESDITYDKEGRTEAASNPYWLDQPQVNAGAVQVYYDPLGRKIVEVEQDGSREQWCYDGKADALHPQLNCNLNRSSITSASWVDYQDESGNDKQLVYDSRQELRAVVEPGGLETDYNYDALGNLQTVAQNGSTTDAALNRTFTYDALSRLVCSSNPETNGPTGGPAVACPTQPGSYPLGATTYSYDSNSNLKAKTDANGVVTTYDYDALDRMTNETASDGSDAKTLYYDTAPSLWGGTPFSCTNGIGRVCQADHAGYSGTAFNYDSMGRVTSTLYGSITDGPPYKAGISIAYNRAGNPKVLTYPDGRSLQQSWDSADRLLSITDATPGGSGTTYFSSAQYWPSGALRSSNIGSGIAQTLTINSRLQPCRAAATWFGSGSTVPLLDRQIFYNFAASSPCGNEGADNGNIYSIVDNLQVGLTQSFSYDTLNRVTVGSRSDGAYNHTYNYDSFGNMTVKDNLASNSILYKADPATNRLLRSHDGGATWGDYVYDDDGVLTQSSDGLVPAHTYQHNPDGQIISIDDGQTMKYAYNGQGERAYKLLGGTYDNGAEKYVGAVYTNYIYMNGQPMAEEDQNGNWTDYIYANAQKVARVSNAQNVIHVHGGNCSGCDLSWNWIDTYFAPGVGYQIKSGDKLIYKQRQVGLVSGIYIMTAQGSNSCCVSMPDQNGDGTNTLYAADGLWHDRIVDISLFAGQTISNIGTDDYPGADPWDAYFADIAILSTDGTVIPIFDGQSGFGMPFWGPGGESDLSATVDAVTTDSSTDANFPTAHYYIDDHLGSAQLELSTGGWPIWEGQFTPFGQEIVSGQLLSSTIGNQQPADGSSMHYKFTGKERDTESGLDYFGARYYASSTGRWTSPDWSKTPEGVPYADLSNPQSLNLYAYVDNNPLSRTDTDGHIEDLGDFFDFLDQAAISGNRIADKKKNNSAQQNAANKATVTVKKDVYSNKSIHPGNNGASLRLEAFVSGGNYVAYNWKQMVTRTSGGETKGPFNDAAPDTGLYWSAKDQSAAMADAAKNGGSTYFVDSPDFFGGVSGTWNANLSLIGIDKSGGQNVLWSTSWGFSVKGATGTVTLDPLTGKVQ